jgi:serine/threonine-protein kinase
MRSVEYNAEKRFESAGQMRDALIKHLSKLNSGQISFGVKQTPKAISLEEQPVVCGFCGQRIVASDMFCAFCGAKQPLAQPGIHSKNYVHVTTTARLMIAGTSELDSPTFVLEKNENLVGRRDPLSNIFPEVDLSKYDPQTKISRKHAKIWREGDKFLVEDLGSSNGTLLISEIKESIKLEPNKALELTNGDKIKLGDTTLQFVIQ